MDFRVLLNIILLVVFILTLVLLKKLKKNK